MKKITKRILLFLTAFVLFITSTSIVNAASDSIELGGATKVNPYIGGVSFYYKVTKDGRYLYCLNMNKKTAENTKAHLVRNSKYITGGLVHILKNGYPNKSITGDKDKDYYITQTAVWWYLDKTTGSTNLGETFKETGSDAYNMRSLVRNLMEEGYAHRNDGIGVRDANLTIASELKNNMEISGNYYVSNYIKAVKYQNVDEYTVSLENAPKDTIIISSNGTETPYTKAFNVKATDKFKVKVPVTSVENSKLLLKVNASANGASQYMAYEYQPEDNSMQNVALLEKTDQKVTSNVTLEVLSSKVTVTKVDSNTKKSLAGAKLVLKDSTGKQIASWTSTTNAHIIRNLTNGDYTIEEIESPQGYALNKNITKFTISDKTKDINITIENAPRKVTVTITKLDRETRTALSGAVLVVKDSNGTEIVRFTTTNQPYVLTDLKNGTYTVEEVSAPAGYIKSNDKMSFTIDESHPTHQVEFTNTKEVIVPNTASTSSILFTIIGIVITTTGICYVVKNGKKA